MICDECKVPLVNDSCPKCGVYHGDPCLTCGRGGYHKDGCPESDATKFTSKKPWHTNDCRCIFKPRDLGQYGEDHCTACDGLYRGHVSLCPVHKAAPELLASLETAFIALGRAGGNMMPDPNESPEGAYLHGKIRGAWEAARAALALTEVLGE